ncbi:MAG: anti-sigma regulatory factor [Catenulispora sp.]|nr:anti-sigma regulatory factor [Catenulispora sp.]
MDPETRSAGTAPGGNSGDSWSPPAAETVLVRVPADPDYLAVIRSASAHVGTKLGCTLSEVADLRLAVDEACGLLLRNTVRDRSDRGEPPADGEGDLECRFVLDKAALRVVLSLRARDASRPDAAEFGWTILAALVDDVIWRDDGPTVRVELVKRRPAGR